MQMRKLMKDETEEPELSDVRKDLVRQQKQIEAFMITDDQRKRSVPLQAPLRASHSQKNIQQQRNDFNKTLVFIADPKRMADSLGTTNFRKSFLRESGLLDQTVIGLPKLEHMRKTYEQMTKSSISNMGDSRHFVRLNDRKDQMQQIETQRQHIRLAVKGILDRVQDPKLGATVRTKTTTI